MAVVQAKEVQMTVVSPDDSSPDKGGIIENQAVIEIWAVSI